MKLRNVFVILLVAALLPAAMPVGVAFAARTPVLVYVDNRELDANPGAFAENGRTMVPMRAIFEALHAEVEWDERTGTVTGKTADRTVVLRLGARTAQVNGQTVTLDEPARLMNGRVMVPLRFVSESLGYPVYFHDKGGSKHTQPKVAIFTNPAVAVTYGDPIEGADSNDYYYDDYFSPAVRYIFTDGERIHILHAGQSNSLRTHRIDNEKPVEITVYHYDMRWNLLGRTVIGGELPLFGGFHRSDDGYYYIVYGQKNYEEDPDKTVYRIVKYDTNWKKVGQGDLRNVYTRVPFDASNVSMASRDGVLVLDTARLAYMTSDGLTHQMNATFKIDTSDLTGDFSPLVYVSHSFAAHVRFDGSRIVYAHHGDAAPRAFVLIIEDDGLKTSERIVLPLPGERGENFTGANLGGLEVSETHYLLAGSSIYPGQKFDIWTSRNVFVAAVPKSDPQYGEIRFNWLTDLEINPAEDAYPTVLEVHLVPIGNDRFAVIWAVKDWDPKIAYYYTVYCAIIDGTGKTVKEPVKLGVPPPGNIDPLLIGNKLYWYDEDGGKTAFYSVDLSKL